MSILKSQKLAVGQRVRQQQLVEWLHSSNYSLVDTVISFGQFSRRGDRIIVHPVNQVWPMSVDFFGENIEKMELFDPVAGEKHEISKIEITPNIVDDDGLRFEPGQYVVHLDHGIGQFRTLGMRRVDKFEETPIPKAEEKFQTIGWKPFLIIDYADGAELYIPPNQANKLTHYIGSRSPALSKLGTQRWQITKKKVEESLIKMARELIAVAAKRQVNPRAAYQIQFPWLKQVSTEFSYDETDDQQKAIEAVIADLQQPRPMDRLICGDVGFGKTEVAIRATVAAVSAGYQVALLAPTTLLVQQHYATLIDRLKSLPIKTAHLSRFVSQIDQDRIVQGLEQGVVDVVVGTHRLIQPDVRFKKLGLIIIDEEQKFGVRHKEHLKKLRASVDVLTLSATPIPRTLFSGLSGLRDISLIMTPPKKRLPIKTIISRAEDGLIVDAIKKEKARGGQAFVLHNDVVSIEARARNLREQLPEVVLEIAHGQMPENQLSKVMERMIHGQIDVLLTSTIIESGLDMPRVNTLIVERSDHFGLADLYQLRGRVGRSETQAFAYFLYDIPELPTIARQRFKALIESEELGSGYSVALRDLEIRGGGNILGREQHGNMEAIGLSLYTKLLKITVEKLQSSTSSI